MQNDTEMPINDVMRQELPYLALKQIGDMILTVTDRILTVPSPWQICLSPLFIWLTLHKDDGVCDLVLTKEVK